ncbi:MAG: polysaccharide deacetylase family protein [Desulfobacterales bacterium]|nr:MAG: polysaccharide deacetylase family protein [Desulfobacterales bacterium]
MMVISRQCLLAFMLVLCVFSGALARADNSAVVLMYHRFGEDRYPETNIRVEQFEAQLELLKKEGYTVVPLSKLLATLIGRGSLPPKSVVITIDDAYRSIYEVAYPMLRQYGFPFTVFVATDPVDNKLPAYMTWEQMREMAGGGADFANHGASHLSMIKRLEGESDEARIARVLADVEKGRRRLVEELKPVPHVFAYPYGEYDGPVAEKLRKMGYICFGQHSGPVGPKSDLRALPRFPVAEAYADIGEFRVKIKSLPMPVEAVTPWEPVVNDNRPEIEIALGKADARLSELACFVGGQGRVPVRWIEAGKRFTVAPKRPLGTGRQRVNCTAPRHDGRYLWFSHPWFVNVSKQ